VERFRKMNIFKELEWRGFIHETSDEQFEELLPRQQVFYAGFDPTAASLQLGNLIPLIAVIHLARAGLKPIILFGGATGFIGDPSGKSQERKLLDPQTIERNVKLQSAQIRAIFSRLKLEATFVNNLDWTHQVTLLDFLRDTGKHFTVNYMISKEVVKNRLESSGISYTEFSYMLLQAYDFLHLFKSHDCTMQIGGSDQWGNITAGLELIRRKGFAGKACAFCIPLLTDTQGRKFGKSEAGSLWLDPDQTSPFELHQFFLNREDAELGKLLAIFTQLEKSDIDQIILDHQQQPEKRLAQNVLADQVVDLVHGPDGLKVAKQGAGVLFGGQLEDIDDATLDMIARDIPASDLERAQLADMTVFEFLVAATLVKSKGEARRLVDGGGAYLNNNRIVDGSVGVETLLPADRTKVLLRSGKKKYHLVNLI